VGAEQAVIELVRRLIYFPEPDEPAPVASVLPGAESVSFTTADGLQLAGWYSAAHAPEQGSTVLVFNGNAGDRSARAPLADALRRAGLAVLLMDYRGYGGNPGSPSEAGLIENARAARAYLSTRAEVDPKRIAYFGESLGSGVAVALAVEQPPAALVLRSPFTSLLDMGRLHYPFLPLAPPIPDRFDSLGRIGRVRCPVLVIAGDSDRIVPLHLSQRLYEAAPDPKQFLLVPGADHNDFALLAGRELIERVVRFVTEAGSQGATR
jgi:fermentation-respiration switch protein FrsA (DUF1100 family)